MMKKFEWHDDRASCCGCGACAAECPEKALTMMRDGEGFLYPTLNQKLCVNCGRCQQVCPLEQPEFSEETPITLDLRSKDETILRASTSGGVFAQIALAFLKAGGKVCGAAFDSQLSVRHIVISSSEDVSRLIGAKYVQSDTTAAFAEIKKLTHDGTSVLFCGTPCQTEAVRRLCGKTGNLFTVSVLCSGVPSPAVWEDYLGYLADADNGTPTAFLFDAKEEGSSERFCAHTFNGETKTEPSEKNPYLALLRSRLDSRPSCATCPFTRPDRNDDLVLGSLSEDGKTEFSDVHSTTLVLINTERGKTILKAVLPSVNAVPIGKRALSHPQLERPEKAHPLRPLFFFLFRRISMKHLLELFAHVKPKKKKFRISRFWRHLLYWFLQLTWGALQNFFGAILWLFLTLKNPERNHRTYHGAVVSDWGNKGSMALGMFIFFGQKREPDAKRILVHEYGHTLQSCVLGPFFLLVIGIPSLLWAGLPACKRFRKKHQIYYIDFYCEHWANRWGKKALGKPAIARKSRQ